MSKDKGEIFAGNAAIVQAKDFSSPATFAMAAQALFGFTGDARGTGQVRPVPSEAASKGCWM